MKTVLAAFAIAASVLAVPAIANAQPRHPGHGPVHVQKHVVHKQMFRKKVVVVKQHHWARGRALPSHYRRNVVTDYHRYHLGAPGPGQRWVRVDNQFILINSVSGLIASLMAAR